MAFNQVKFIFVSSYLCNMPMASCNLLAISISLRFFVLYSYVLCNLFIWKFQFCYSSNSHSSIFFIRHANRRFDASSSKAMHPILRYKIGITHIDNDNASQNIPLFFFELFFNFYGNSQITANILRHLHNLSPNHITHLHLHHNQIQKIYLYIACKIRIFMFV